MYGTECVWGLVLIRRFAISECRHEIYDCVIAEDCVLVEHSLVGADYSRSWSFIMEFGDWWSIGAAARDDRLRCGIAKKERSVEISTVPDLATLTKI